MDAYLLEQEPPLMETSSTGFTQVFIMRTSGVAAKRAEPNMEYHPMAVRSRICVEHAITDAEQGKNLFLLPLRSLRLGAKQKELALSRV